MSTKIKAKKPHIFLMSEIGGFNKHNVALNPIPAPKFHLLKQLGLKLNSQTIFFQLNTNVNEY